MSNLIVRPAIAGGVLALAGTVLVAPSSHADDDFKKRSGSCGKNAKWTMTLAERDDDRLRTTFFLNTQRKNAKWNITVKRAGKVVHRVSKRTNHQGNLYLARGFRGDDDAYVRVIARSAYGPKCAPGMRLDDGNDDD